MGRREYLEGLFKRHLLVIFMLLFTLLAFIWPSPGVWLRKLKWKETRIVTCLIFICIFFINGMKLRTAEVKAAASQPLSLIYGMLSILFLTCVIGAKLTSLASGIFSIPEFKLAIQLFVMTPTSTAIGILIVEQFQGNTTMALALSVLTNSLATFTVPPMIGWLLSLRADVKLNISKLMISLVGTVLTPLLIGKLVTIAFNLDRCIKENTFKLKLINSITISMLPYMEISQALIDGAFVGLRALDYITSILWFFVLLSIFLVLNSYIAFYTLRLNLQEAIALIVMGSQKTLTVALAVLSFLPSSVGNSGLLMIGTMLPWLGQTFYLLAMMNILSRLAPRAASEDSDYIRLEEASDNVPMEFSQLDESH